MVCLALFLRVAIADDVNKAKTIVDADKVFYEKKNDLMIAKGNVEVFKDGLLINADKLTFDRKKDIVTVSGNVRIVDPSGEEFYGTKAEILHKVKEAVIYDLHAKLQDKINFGAARAKYFTNDKILKMRKASLTTCEVCKGSSPQWQFNSSQVKFDENNDMVYHRNSFFEVYGFPVFYTPYFSHLAPNAAPRSGFLFPSYKYKTFYGNGAELKYYYRISNSADLLYKPVITQHQGILHQLDYQQKFNKADLNFRGSYNKPKTSNSVKYPSNRFHYDAQYKQKLNDYFSLDARLNKVSDKNYLRQYYEGDKNYLTSNLTLDYYQGRDYGSVKNLYFQGLRDSDNQATTPYVLPYVDFHKEWNQKANNFEADLNLLNLNKNKGLNTNRYIIEGGWNRSDFFTNGLEWKNRLLLRGDLYMYHDRNEYQPDSGSSVDKVNSSASRYLQMYQTDFSYPLMSTKYNYISIVQPMVQFIAAPNYSQTHRIVNEDSLNVEINDANLFSSNRYSGYDRFEGGSRLNYGLVGSMMHRENMDTSYFYMIGQSYRFKKNAEFGLDSGMADKVSDVVGHFGVKPNKHLNIFYRYRFDPRGKTFRRNELNLGVNYFPLSVDSKFVRYNYESVVDNTAVTQSVSLSPKFAINKEWSVEGSVVRNGSRQNNFLVSSGVGLVYDGRCTWFKIRLDKNYTRNGQLRSKPNSSIVFDFILKGLQ